MSGVCFKRHGKGEDGVTHPPGTVVDLYVVKWHLPPQKRLDQELLATVFKEVMNYRQTRNQNKT